MHDGIGVSLAARRLNADRFVWPRDMTGTLSLSRTQFDALVLGLPIHLAKDIDDLLPHRWVPLNIGH